ncbi:MAG TPA: potassium-transporting ATPase subunit B, partial [Mycobacterium sp.]|nr:potassium-transporting ATPase subunit B [Mycobacterium sp.]
MTVLAEKPAPTETKPTAVKAGLLDPAQLWRSLPDALLKLDPRTLWRNPVMFIVEVGAVFTTVLSIADSSTLAWIITVWLWLTVVFANLAEAVAEGRGKAQAAALRAAKQDTVAHLQDGRTIPAPHLKQGDVVVVEAGQTIPGDGDVIEG